MTSAPENASPEEPLESLVDDPAPMEIGILKERLTALLAEEETESRRERMIDLVHRVRPEDIADVLADFSPEDTLRVFEVVPRERQGEVLDETDWRSTSELLDALPASTLTKLLALMPPDEAADALAVLPSEKREAVLVALPSELAAEIRALSHHEADTAGGIMTSQFIVVGEEQSREEIRRTIESSLDKEVVSYVYVTDDSDVLRGVMSIREVLGAKPDETAGSLMTEQLITAKVSDDQEEVANLARKYNLNSIPIVDDFGRLVGVATIDDIIDVISEEADEDIYRLAGTSGDHPTQRGLFVRVRERIKWLLISVLGGSAVGALHLREVGDKQERYAGIDPDALGELLAMGEIFAWTPMVIGVSGAAGIQVATLLTRGIATGEIDLSRTWRVVRHELTIGVSIALFYGFIAFLALTGIAQLGLFQVHHAMPHAVGLGLVTGILIATTSGTLIPPVCRQFGIDPALVSGPFITSLNDLLAASCYLAVAQWLVARGAI